MSGRSEPRTPNRWGEGARLRGDILAAAARLLAESGREDALSLRAVAREAGIAAPSIYLHFKDRSELVAAVMRGAYGAHAAELRRTRLLEPAGDPVDALRAMAHGYCRFALENPARYRLMFGVEQIETPAAPGPTGHRLPGHPVHEVLDEWTLAVDACRKAGPEGNGRLSAERAASLLWAGLHGIVGLWSAMPLAPDLESMCGLADDLVDSLLTG
ncbi:TetR/AcrR family transcriptional regulator [Streptomyces sp. NPDC005648]|uniref:TetR/AcrR family transcriptional regulator n=1 Tax=Streptomyces sp. NPDC005648 TaxID=3157044 RepID=UPI00339E5A67